MTDLRSFGLQLVTGWSAQLHDDFLNIALFPVSVRRQPGADVATAGDRREIVELCKGAVVRGVTQVSQALNSPQRKRSASNAPPEMQSAERRF